MSDNTENKRLESETLKTKKREVLEFIKTEEDLLEADLSQIYQNHVVFVKRFTFSEHGKQKWKETQVKDRKGADNGH